MARRRAGRWMARLGLWTGLVGIVAVLAFPLFHLALTSLKILKYVYEPATLFPPREGYTLDNYSALFTTEFTGLKGNLLTFILNSSLVSVFTTGIAIAIGALAAYGFSRYPLPGDRVLFLGILLLYMIPEQSLMIPLYFLVLKVGLYDTLSGIVVAYTARLLPFVIWMLTGFFRDLPRELEEAAEIDGCGRLQTFFRIVVPLARPGLAVTAIYTFIFAWQQFLLPLILTSSTDKYLITTAIAFFIQEHGVQWGQMTATGTLATLPSLLFALLVQKHIIRGISFGALKG